MTGLITTLYNNVTYIFRDDHAHEKGIWAWDIHDDYDKARVHKWKKLPRKSHVEFFDIENPPQTVRYLPLLN